MEERISVSALERYPLPDRAAVEAALAAEAEKSRRQIVVLDDDHIAGRGTHEELLASNTIYQEIYQSQQEGVGG